MPWNLQFLSLLSLILNVCKVTKVNFPHEIYDSTTIVSSFPKLSKRLLEIKTLTELTDNRFIQRMISKNNPLMYEDFYENQSQQRSIYQRDHKVYGTENFLNHIQINH